MTYYVPGTEEKDPAKIIMSLQQVHGNTAANTTSIAALNAATYVNSFKARTGAVVPAQGDYPTSLIPGTTTNDDATAGNIGEYVESNIAIGSAVSLTSGVAVNVTSISLTAGDWDVTGNVTYAPGATTNFTLAFNSISNTSATQDQTTGGAYIIYRFPAGNVPIAGFNVGGLGPVRKSLASTTTIYLVAQATFTVSTMGAFGIIRARRVR